MIGEQGQVYVPVQADEVMPAVMSVAAGSGDQATGGITVRFSIPGGITGVGWSAIGRENNPPKTIPEAQQAIIDYISIKPNKSPFLDESNPWYGCWD